MDGFEILESNETVKEYLDDVQRVGDENRNALGFFPRTVYEQFARAGCLYVVTKRVFVQFPPRACPTDLCPSTTPP